MPNRMDSLLSHGMGKVNAVKARLSGLVGVFKTLAEQHGAVKVLLERAKSSDAKFAELWPTIRSELLSHEKAELRELYPILRTRPETHALANRHEAEAKELEERIGLIGDLPVGAPERHVRFQHLIDAVMRHADEEETEIFPAAQKVLGRERAEALEEAFLAAKNEFADYLTRTTA